jgi:hypothetical protein
MRSKAHKNNTPIKNEDENDFSDEEMYINEELFQVKNQKSQRSKKMN